ncbi:putative bolA-like protein K11H12.1 [Hyalella azteca]|uniref:BolA-like protein K11H12.1 n=1 Tax=Hyalella azteca TaxID=294128 RepID=A0A8B7PA00_HYAAZ|nr:putative bolA-like protein K11H12.1 [Hyalella azteca]
MWHRFGQRAMTSAAGLGPVGRRIADKLAKSVAGGGHVAVVDESHMHNVPRGAETHFKVLVVSTRFQGMPLIQRHRLVNDVLAEELASGVHALSILVGGGSGAGAFAGGWGLGGWCWRWSVV